MSMLDLYGTCKKCDNVVDLYEECPFCVLEQQNAELVEAIKYALEYGDTGEDAVDIKNELQQALAKNELST